MSDTEWLITHMWRVSYQREPIVMYGRFASVAAFEKRRREWLRCGEAESITLVEARPIDHTCTECDRYGIHQCPECGAWTCNSKETPDSMMGPGEPSCSQVHWMRTHRDTREVDHE